MDHLEPLFKQFLWWEEHQDKLDPYDSDNSEWIHELKKKFEKQCKLLFKTDPQGFIALCKIEEFCDQIDLYGLCYIVDKVLIGTCGKYLTKYYMNDEGEITYIKKNYRVTWRGVFTCEIEIC